MSNNFSSFIDLSGNTILKSMSSLEPNRPEEEPIPTYPYPFPVEFGRNEKRWYHPIKTSYYVAWVDNRDSDEWVYPLLENKNDTPLVRAARKAYWSRFTDFGDIGIRCDHAKEFRLVEDEYSRVKKIHDPSYQPLERTPLPEEKMPSSSNFFQKYKNLLWKIGLVVAVVLGGIAILLGCLFRKSQH
jgi:hypothetical protein